MHEIKSNRYEMKTTNICDGRLLHDDVIKWNHFLHNWPFVWGIHQSPVNSPHKSQWRGALMFSLICTSINGSVNNHEASDLRHHHCNADGKKSPSRWWHCYLMFYSISWMGIWRRSYVPLLWALLFSFVFWWISTHPLPPPDKMAAILQMTFSNTFLWMKSCVLLFEFHCNLFLRVQLMISQYWFK